MSYVGNPFAISTVATAKLSILCLYRRIFSTPSFRINSLIIGLFVVAYWITSMLGMLLQCIPVQGIWQKTPSSKCIDSNAFFLGLELLNCILDVAMLCLALKVIRGLQVPMKQKIALAMVFLLGSWSVLA